MDRWAAYGPSDIPPRDARLINPEKDKIITRVDDRGLILVDSLIEEVKATIDPTYTWPGGLEVHHFYWYDAWYPNNLDVDPAENPAVFRNLAIHKGLMPKIFEAWLHKITLPAEVPSVEVRRNRVQAWWTAKNLFAAAKESEEWLGLVERRRQYIAQHPEVLREELNGKDIYGEAIMQEILEKNFHRFESHLKQHEKIPQEFRIVEDQEPAKIVTALSKIVTRKSLHLTPIIKAA